MRRWRSRAGIAGVEPGIVLGGSPRCVVGVGAEENGPRSRMIRRRGPDRAGRGTELEDVLSPGVLDGDRRVQAFGLGANVILPGDAARLWLQGHDETATGETFVAGAKIPDPLFEGAARDDDFAVGQDGSGKRPVQG